jgi:hypothetical protein
MNDKDIIDTALHRMTMAIAAYSDSREDELDDLRFYAASPDNQFQWPADVLATRGAVQGQTINARPCLTINKLPQHVRQVTNDQRQNRPSGKVIPADDKADVEVAEIFNGMVRHIEYMSDADVAYDTACENQVAYGEGYIRLLTEYESPNSFDQTIKIGRIRNSFSVYMDPTIQDPCGSDAQWCFVTEDVLLEDFERMFPDAQPVSSLQAQSVGNESYAPWLSVDTIRIADYYYVEHEKATLNLYYGNVSALKGSPEDQQMVAMKMKPIKSRIVDVKKVRHCKINGFEVLESNDWAGDWIPVVRVVGNEFEIDGRIHVSGIVRNAKDAQRMYNYWVSQEAEMLALAPKAPFIGYGGQFEGYEQQWKTANTTNWPYLEVNPDVSDGAGTPLPLPQRSQPPMAQTGLIQAKMGASDDIKGTTGQYDSSLGATSNERSGKAIMARERQTDTGTYHYVDNLARAIRHITRQIVGLVPKLYDTQRIARIMGEDGQPDSAKIDPNQAEPVKKIVDQNGIEIDKIYNPGVGTYDVMVTTGPSYMTKRQEALESMGQLLQGNPQLWAVAGDLFIKNMDWPGAQEMAKRFAKTIDPKLMDTGDKDPALQAAEQQMQAMAQEMENMHKMLQNVSKSIEMKDIEIKENANLIKAFDAETKRIAAVQASMSPEQIQDIVMGTVHSMITSGDLISEMPVRGQAETQEDMGMQPPEAMQPTAQPQPMQPPEGMQPQGMPPQ